jgi:hypothetical protein
MISHQQRVRLRLSERAASSLNSPGAFDRDKPTDASLSCRNRTPRRLAAAGCPDGTSLPLARPVFVWYPEPSFLSLPVAPTASLIKAGWPGCPLPA